jgi:aminotransferase
MNMSDSKSHPSYVARYLNEVPRSGIRDFFDIVSTRKDVISLGIGEPDFVTPWHIRESSVYALDHGATSYTANLGLLELRQAISRYVKRRFQATYDADTEILITVGVSEALDLAIRALVEPGDEVLYHEPCYVSYAPIVTFAHGVPVEVETRREDYFRLTREALEAKVTDKTKVLLLNFPTNPTGAILTQSDIEQIAEFAIEHDIVVITDEIYSELTYEDDRTSIAAIPGMKPRTIFLNGFSKAWAMTGFRIGFSCAPSELTEAMMKIHQYTMLCAPILAQKAAIEALENGDHDVDEMRRAYRRRRNIMVKGFEAAGIPCPTPKGAFYAFPYVGDFGMSSHEFAIRLLEEENVACVPGTAFGPCGEGFVRCCYATATDEIQEALTRINRFVKRLG